MPPMTAQPPAAQPSLPSVSQRLPPGRNLTFYQHRVNTLQELRQLPLDVGVEFDLRSDGDDVLVTHDPFTSGPEMEVFFAEIGPRPCIFNVKCEGIEARVLQAARRHGVEDFFFLDLSVPAAWNLAQLGETRFAVRWSEVEPIDAVLAWQGRAQWVWIDCFTHFPGTLADWQRLAMHFKLCVVSPELQRHAPTAMLETMAQLAGKPFDAVCSKQRALWQGQ